MSCACHCAATAAFFDRRMAEQDLRRYRRRGPDGATRQLLEFLRRTPLKDQVLLDVGAGVGVIGLELQRDGIREVVMVDASPAYLAVAREQFAGSAHATPYRQVEGNFTEVEPALEADIVTLDKVVCCYPDYRTLLRRAGESARVTLAFSFPKDVWYVRLALQFENLFLRLKGSGFRAFVHPEPEMAGELSRAGLRRMERKSSLYWCAE